LARASAPPRGIELCWTLLGWRKGRLWYTRLNHYRAGLADGVEFDGPLVLQREERRHDVQGFLHTHPDGPLHPSRRDVRTMRAWCSAFGKPLLCVIFSAGRLAGFRFDDDTSDGIELETVEWFPRCVVIGVEADGGQVSS
jgi:proteasome lid subunit RPN8/RPN11